MTQAVVADREAATRSAAWLRLLVVAGGTGAGGGYYGRRWCGWFFNCICSPTGTITVTIGGGGGGGNSYGSPKEGVTEPTLH